MTSELSIFFHRVEQSERALYVRCVDHAQTSKSWRAFWTALTHLGGTACSIAAVILPLFLTSAGAIHEAARHGLVILVVSHFVVQLVKRTVNRPRPSRREITASLVDEPDKFSLPSGHSCAVMAVCFTYAMAFPSLALPLVALAGLVGASRVFLGVHYPGDVVIGQIIAIAVAIPILS
jgi:undecaprenyl-diphosphatase